MSDEVGRQLSAKELEPQQIVWIEAPGNPELIFTMRVEELRDNIVVFFSGKLNRHVVNVIQPNGEVVDDQGRVVRVFEYLGQP